MSLEYPDDDKRTGKFKSAGLRTISRSTGNGWVDRQAEKGTDTRTDRKRHTSYIQGVGKSDFKSSSQSIQGVGMGGESEGDGATMDETQQG